LRRGEHFADHRRRGDDASEFNSLAFEIDRYQSEFQEGPCLDAITEEPMLYADDLTDDVRWPSFGPMAVSLGMRSLLSCRLSASETLGSLNLYARNPQAYGAIDRSKALIFATHAGLALGAAGVLATKSLASIPRFVDRRISKWRFQLAK
jgi:hypothetical protein